MMDSTYEPVELLSVDMDELGVRPLDWMDINKDIDDPMNVFFGKEKTVDFTVYSAELQSINNGKKLTTNEEDSSMSDDAGQNYEIDPETGEKIFHEVTFESNASFASPNNKWIEEYLSNIESSSSNQILPHTTINNSEFLFENISIPLIEDTNDQTNLDWFSNIINLDENSNNMMFNDSIIQNQYINDNELTTYTSLSSENNTQSSLINPLNISIDDDEYSNSNGSHQNQFSSSLEDDNEITLIETKLEKIEPDENVISRMVTRRTSNNTRTQYQGQQDEDALRQNNIPLTLNDITQSSTEEYNRHLARLAHLTPEQLHIIKDIRRRGKNKIAAQNCRKRKAVSVESLLEEIDELKRVKHELEERKRAFQQQITETRSQYEYLHRQVLPDRQLPPAIIVK